MNTNHLNKEFYAAAFNTIKDWDMVAIGNNESTPATCTIHCLNGLNAATPYFYLSLRNMIKDETKIKFYLEEIPACRVNFTVSFTVSFKNNDEMRLFYDKCMTGKVNTPLISHRDYQLDFSDERLANINLHNPDNARFIPINLEK